MRQGRACFKKLGFEEKKKKSGSSHRQFKKIVDGHMFKVTLDCHKGEVSAKNVRSIISQAGSTAEAFYKAAGMS